MFLFLKCGRCCCRIIQRIREKIDAYFLERSIANINQGKGALYPHVEEIFSYLRDNNYSIFIASNGLIEYLKAIVSFYQLDRWVTETFSIQQIHTLNKGDLVNTILKKYGIQQAAVDINAAKDNGLMAIGCHFDFAQEEELAQADFVIHDLIELKTLLPELKKGDSVLFNRQT